MLVVSSRSGATKVKTLKVAAEIRTVSASASATCGFKSTLNSAVIRADWERGVAGRSSAIAAAAIRPSNATAQKEARQPNAWPSAVLAGTPKTFDAAMPAHMRATADARRSGGTRLAATSEPMPKKAPWQKLATILAAISSA